MDPQLTDPILAALVSGLHLKYLLYMKGYEYDILPTKSTQ